MEKDISEKRFGNENLSKYHHGIKQLQKSDQSFILNLNEQFSICFIQSCK